MSPFHHLDTSTTQTVASHGLHFPSVTALHNLTVTAASHQQSHLHLIYRLAYKLLTPSVQGEVLFSPVWHFWAFSLCLFLPCIILDCLYSLWFSAACPFDHCSCFSTLFMLIADCCLPRPLPGIRLCLWIICVIPDAGDWSLFVSDIELIKTANGSARLWLPVADAYFHYLSFFNTFIPEKN